MDKGDVAKFVQKNNIVMLQTDNFVPRTCEYYLHFNVNLPYPCKIKWRSSKNTVTAKKIVFKNSFLSKQQ